MNIDLNKFEKILVLNSQLWEDKASLQNVTQWLEGFNNYRQLTIDEIDNLIYALENFLYFGSRLIRELLKTTFRDLYQYNIIQGIRRENSDTLDKKIIEVKLKEKINKTRFLGMGNPSESGVHLLYYFRQENNLPKNLFIHQHEIFKRDITSGTIELKCPDIEQYIFIDDFCGSGNQTVAYLKNAINDIKHLNPNANISYYTLFSTSTGINHIKNNTLIDNIGTSFELDESFKIFSDESRFYNPNTCPPNIDKNILKSICSEFCEFLYIHKSMHFGYDQSQLMIGFHHNTPDNTLPIFWYYFPQRQWYPIFKRYHKQY